MFEDFGNKATFQILIAILVEVFTVKLMERKQEEYQYF